MSSSQNNDEFHIFVRFTSGRQYQTLQIRVGLSDSVHSVAVKLSERTSVDTRNIKLHHQSRVLSPAMSLRQCNVYKDTQLEATLCGIDYDGTTYHAHSSFPPSIQIKKLYSRVTAADSEMTASVNELQDRLNNASISDALDILKTSGAQFIQKYNNLREHKLVILRSINSQQYSQRRSGTTYLI